MNAAVYVSLAVALIGPVVTYILAARRMSGKIATSDASDLWAESTSIRSEYRARITYLEKRIDAVEQRNDDLERENRGLHREIDDLKRRGGFE